MGVKSMLQARLKVVGGKHDGQYIPLTTERFLIGREEDCHLRPSSEMISRHHCAITLDGFTVRLRDLGSTNGTFVNGERIHHAVTLSQGDRIEVGKLCFEISITEVTVESGTQPAEPMPDSVLSGETAELSSSDTSDEIPVAPVLGDSNTNLNAGSETTVMAPVPAADDSSSVIAPQQPAGAYPPQPAGYAQPPGYPQPPMMYPQPPMMYPQPLYPNYPQPFVYPQAGMPYGQPPMMYPQPGTYPQGTPAPAAPETSAPQTSEEEHPVNLPPPETTGVREPEQAPAADAPQTSAAADQTAKETPKDAGTTANEPNPSETAADIIHQHFNRRPPTP